MKKVSIICAVYNSDAYLHQLIDSIINQSYLNFECLFINDASTDKSVDIIQSIDDKRFTLIHNKTNLGAQQSRKIGFQSALGAYVVFIDSDDFLNHHYLKKLVHQLETDQSDIVMCNYEVINNQNKVLRRNLHVTPIPKKHFPLQAYNHRAVIMSKPAFWNKLFRHSFLVDRIIFPDVSLAQDLSIMPLLLSSGNISYVDEVLYHYRINEASISNTYDKRLLNIQQSFYSLRELKKDFYPELVFIAIGHYYYQMSKALFINDKHLRISVYRELRRNLKSEFPNYQKNEYLRKRIDYRIFIFILNKNIIFENNFIHALVSRLLKIKFVNQLIRKSDK